MSFVTIRAWLAALCLLLLVGCGGGGSGTAGTSLLGSGSGTPSSGGSGGGTGTGTTASATVAVALSSTTVTAASPATVTVTVRDATGSPVSGSLVKLSTLLQTLATLSVPSVVTDSSGSATAVLSAAPAGLPGADQVVALVSLGTTSIQGTVAFSVTGSQPTIGLSLSSATLRVSTGPATAKAVLKDGAGNPVASQVVSFASGSGFLKLSAPSAVTDGFGTATISISAADAAQTAADTLVASAKVNTIAVQSTQAVQLIADTPSMSISATPTNTASAAAPSTLAMLVKDTTGAPVAAGTIVTVSSSFGLSALSAASVATDATGVARVVVTPASSTSNGADQIVASTTVGGVTVTQPFVVLISASSSAAPPVLQEVLSSTSVSSATPATVTATLTASNGTALAGQVVTFSTVLGLAKTNVGTALTDANGKAVVILSPASSSVAGADQVVATVNYGGTTLTSTQGFQIQATNVTLSSFTSAVATLGAYGQTTLTVGIAGASVGSPVNVSVTSSCVSLGKATLSPTTFTATSATVDLQYKDSGCGAVQTSDKLQASIVGTGSSLSLQLPIATPSASSISFVSAAPQVIYIKGSGFAETSTLTFGVLDGAGNPLPNTSVTLALLTQAGGVTIQGGTANVTQVSDSNGQVTVQVNSGTVPTPIRVSATLTNSPLIATVSSNLSVAVGLPSELNFSLSQQTKNIEGFDIDGTANIYNIIASDRSGNPVPDGTSVNFVTEGGQVQPIVQTAGSPSAARAQAQFLSSNPRPADGRITVTAYALGEESFIDQNGNNAYDVGEPFQDLGNIFKDRIFDGVYDPTVDETISTNISANQPCSPPSASSGATAATNALLALDPSIPSVPGTCDGVWSGAGKVYVRRAIETVLSTSAARALWASKSGLDATCTTRTLQTGPQPTTTAVFTPVQGGETWYTNSASTALPFIVADRNTFPTLGPNGAVGRLNPMAAGTTITASTPTSGVTVTVGGGTPVPSTTEASGAAVGVTFAAGTTAGVVFVTFTSPSGLGTTYAINVQQLVPPAVKPSACP